MVLRTVCFAYNLPHGPGIPTRLETRQDRSLDYVLARRMTRISAAKVICIHNKLIKSQSSHFQRPTFSATWYLSFLSLSPLHFGRSLTALTSFVFVQSKRRLLHKRFARKKCFCYVIQRQTTFSPHNNPPFQRYCNWITIKLSNDDRTWLWNGDEINTTIVIETFDWRPPKLRFSNGKKPL